ncbi:helix-turn-helix domain-containing protein [Mitsuaria sp. TWR114]|uniref:helix-turn-helix transcriptional regulator n=1 Tax=Mitsuaria sp. TWR114 TaxID=2601731 RepID=UPI0011BD617A|nr:helix-turn-helix domain-containing protein [Mitsuaria sp. TWR114]TXD99415.1 helix-turn-helix domain-containing protein [Mitsuaria sp. TWR114]
MSNLSDFKLVTKADAAAMLDCCIKTVDNHVREGRLPAPVAFGSREYWHPEDFKAFLDGTFRRKAPPEVERVHGNQAPAASTAEVVTRPNTGTVTKTVRDSNPAVRQMARQQAKLKALNSPA